MKSILRPFDVEKKIENLPNKKVVVVLPDGKRLYPTDPFQSCVDTEREDTSNDIALIIDGVATETITTRDLKKSLARVRTLEPDFDWLDIYVFHYIDTEENDGYPAFYVINDIVEKESCIEIVCNNVAAVIDRTGLEFIGFAMWNDNDEFNKKLWGTPDGKRYVERDRSTYSDIVEYNWQYDGYIWVF